MGSRLDLQNLLESILGSRNVYYQPPESIRINYPAIIYSRNNIDNNFADDIVYMQNHTYQVIVIDANPDSEIVNKISKLPMCRYDRHYTSDNLNHDVFIINY
jgi:hypothetical protein